MPELGFGFVLETIELFNLSYVSLSNLHQVKIQLFLGNKKDNRKKSRFKMSFFFLVKTRHYQLRNSKC